MHTRVVNSSVLRVVFGVVVGAITGAVVAVNVVIFSGAEDGYETSLPELFDQNVMLGLLVVVILVSGPIVGGVIASRSPARPTD